MTTEDSLPAFPTMLQDEHGGIDARAGMTLRDWFAGQALAGFTSCCLDDGDPVMGAADTAKAAYNYADAMLAARKGGSHD